MTTDRTPTTADAPPCTYRGCGKPEDDAIHPTPDQRMGGGRHVFRHDPRKARPRPDALCGQPTGYAPCMLPFGHIEYACQATIEAAIRAEPRAEGLDMWSDLYARLAEKWGTVLEAADKAEDATVLEVVDALRTQGERRGVRPPKPPAAPKDREWDGT